MKQNRENAFLISVIGGITLLLLAITVFAVASQARSVSTEAERSVTLIEQLRVVSISRAELSIASRIDAVDSEQTVVIEAALQNSADALAAVAPLMENEGSLAVQAAFADYVTTSNGQALLISADGSNPEAAQLAELQTGEHFDALSSELRAEQVLALDQLRKDNDLMNFIGTVATFIVAFIVPSAALYIFEALRRTPRHTRTLELEIHSLRNQAQALAMATDTEVSRIKSHLFSDEANLESINTDALRRSLLRLEHTAAISGAVRSFQASETNVYNVATELASSLSANIAVNFGEADYPAVVVGNHDQVALILYELLLNAIEFGGDPIRVEIDTNASDVTVTVIDRGTGLPEVIETGVLSGSDYAVRNNLMSGEHGFGLLVVRNAVETLGGSLSYLRSVGETSMVIELPRHTSGRQESPERSPSEPDTIIHSDDKTLPHAA